MSQLALIQAARDWLREALDLADAECDEEPDGQPPPACGQRFVAVHGGGGWGSSSVNTLEERLGFRVTITDRVADAPGDRSGSERLLKAKAGLVAFCEDVVAVVHSSYEVMAYANAIIDDGAGEEFQEPPRFRSADGGGAPAYRGIAWFSAGPTEFGGDDRIAGLSVTLNFGDAVRLRSIDNLRVGVTDRVRLEEGGYLLAEEGPYLRLES